MERNVHDNVARRSLKQREGKKIKKEKKKEGKKPFTVFYYDTNLNKKDRKKTKSETFLQ